MYFQFGCNMQPRVQIQSIFSLIATCSCTRSNIQAIFNLVATCSCTRSMQAIFILVATCNCTSSKLKLFSVWLQQVAARVQIQAIYIKKNGLKLQMGRSTQSLYFLLNKRFFFKFQIIKNLQVNQSFKGTNKITIFCHLIYFLI